MILTFLLDAGIEENMPAPASAVGMVIESPSFVK
jgi:hypothetical protein